VVVYRAGARQETHELLGPWSWGFYREAEAFVRCCLGEEQCLADGRDALEDMLLIERILQRAIEDSA
jgi:predicted dehydrogenase